MPMQTLKTRILVAEDDEDDQRLFHDFLHHRNDIILMPIAEDGEELIEELERIPEHTQLPDLIILDQNMPKRNGTQTLQILKQDSRYCHIPVCIYSTYADDTLVKICTQMGACTVISKPITQDGYNRMMDELFMLCNPSFK